MREAKRKPARIRWFYSKDEKTCVAVVGFKRPFKCRKLFKDPAGQWAQCSETFQLDQSHSTVNQYMRKFGFQQKGTDPNENPQSN